MRTEYAIKNPFDTAIATNLYMSFRRKRALKMTPGMPLPPVGPCPEIFTKYVLCLKSMRYIEFAQHYLYKASRTLPRNTRYENTV